MKDKAGIILNRLVYGFTFAILYQIVIGIATSLLSIPLTGNLQDLISGFQKIESEQGPLLVAWWIISTIIITAISLVIIRYRKYFSPYQGEKDIEIPPKITPLTAIIIGGIISFLFFLLDSTIGAVSVASTQSDVHAIYQAAQEGNFYPFFLSIFFSIFAGFIIVGVAGKTSKVKNITEKMDFSDLAKISKIISKNSDDVVTTADTIGLQPGELVHIGERKVDQITYDLIEYTSNSINEKRCEKAGDCLIVKDRNSNFWINITGVHDPSVIQEVGEYFGLHKLIQADIMNTELRPKIEVTENYIFLIMKMPRFDKENNRLIMEQVSLVLGKNYVLSFQEIQGDVFEKIRERIRMGVGDVRKEKSDYLAYLLVDALTDNFFAMIEAIGETTEILEKELMERPTPKTLETIHLLKRQLITLRKITWPLREVTDSFERTPSNLVSSNTRTYLRDVYSHTVQVMDSIESLRDVVGGMLDTYLSSVSNKMNEVMKTLTIIASIFIPITFIAGVYGTNFDYIPELGWEGSYFVMIGAMIIIVIIMMTWFKKKQWF